jgi:hypothetical protein
VAERDQRRAQDQLGQVGAEAGAARSRSLSRLVTSSDGLSASTSLNTT